jgi:cytochrome P450
MAEIPTPGNRIALGALRALLAQRNVLAALEVFHAELGDVFRIPLPGFNPVMLVGPEANRFVLVEGRGDLRWRAEQDPITRLLRHGVLVEDGETHDTLRRQMNPALHRRMVADYTEVMGQCTDAVIDAWRAETPVDMLVEMRRITLLILTKTLFGVDMTADLARLWKPILKALHYIAPGLWMVWRDAPRPGYRPALRQLDLYLRRVIADRRSRGVPLDDLLGMLIASGLPDDLVRDQLLTLIIAGHDTCTALLSWALYELSRRSDIQATAQADVDAVLGAGPPDGEKVGKLRYLEQVMNETLRLYPPVHLGSRIAAADLEFRGYPIPAGQRVVYSIYLTHRDARTWEQPDAFRPERFAGAEARQPYAFLPFGGGSRNCIGSAFAQVEIKVVLSRILQRYNLAFTGHLVGMAMGATLEPRPGVRVRVRPRS